MPRQPAELNRLAASTTGANCERSSGTFTSGDTELEVRRLGCEQDPPEDATGFLEVRVGGERRAGWWCY